jgi:UDP-N-acetylglucosamine--N-acetylmuramyl-(pentapeptide) pyrophosphoryl-undecaprenol N-acetylglucosamine transferase
VYQQCRKKDIEDVMTKYQSEKGIKFFEVLPFFDGINKLYSKSDLVISRSGASSIFEIIGFQKPAVLIPYSQSVNGDQQENADYLKMNRAAIVLHEYKTLEQELTQILIELINDKRMISELSRNLAQLKQQEVTDNFIKILIDC